MRTIQFAASVLFLAWAVSSAAAQDPKPDNPHKSTPHSQDLDKALQYIKAKGVTAAGTQYFSGLAYLLDGRDEYKAGLDSIIDQTLKLFDQKTGLENWDVALGLLFLSEVYKRSPSDKIAAGLKAGVKHAAEGVEPTGGWCHSKGFCQKTDYLKKRGGVDISILTALMLAGLLDTKSAGLEIPGSLVSNAVANLKGQAKGGLLGYGTQNMGSPDRAAARGATFAFALWLGKLTSDPVYAECKQALTQKIANTEAAHAFAPLNFFGVAMGCYATGQYSAFASQWLGRLTFQKDGSIVMRTGQGLESVPSPANVADTAVFAIMILLQEKNTIRVGAPAADPKDKAPKK